MKPQYLRTVLHCVGNFSMEKVTHLIALICVYIHGKQTIMIYFHFQEKIH